MNHDAADRDAITIRAVTLRYAMFRERDAHVTR